MALKVGGKIPNFSAYDTNGNLFESQFFIGKKPLVIYFYPKDDTLGCTAQACSFRDAYEDFKEIGAEVIGISSDSVASHQKFSSRNKLPFILLSDENKKIRSIFGVPQAFLGLAPGRVTYVTDKSGIIKMIFDNSMMPTKHISMALATLKKIS